MWRISERRYKQMKERCEIVTITDIDISKTITLNSEAGPVILPICGVLYYTGNKFVSRMISPTGEVWYHDGIETKCQCIHEGHLIA